jgi:hypothetical protein
LAAASLSVDVALQALNDLRVLQDHGDWVETALCGDKREDFSVQLYFNKPVGLFEVIVSFKSHIDFLGLNTLSPEVVWRSIGYTLEQKKSDISWFHDGVSELMACYGRVEGGGLGIVELRYRPNKSRPKYEEAPAAKPILTIRM